MKQNERLEQYCKQNNLIYNEEIKEKFNTYYELLVETNKVMNLTAITEPDEVELKHFIDSLAAAPYILECYQENKQAAQKVQAAQAVQAVQAVQKLQADQAVQATQVVQKVQAAQPEQRELAEQAKDLSGYKQRFQIVDIGTGAGFPGLPLSFVLPEMEFLLADSLNKRIGFLQEVIARLQCTNVSAIHARAEELGQGVYRQSFDICVSRAVADTAVLAEYCLPLVKPGGAAILYKSGDIHEELAQADYAIEELGGTIEEVRPFQLIDTNIRRSLIIIKKISDTPDKYPRKAGKPAKAPLLRK